jgi:predicted transcriptional regulator
MKEASITIRLSDADKQKIKEIAAGRDISVS